MTPQHQIVKIESVKVWVTRLPSLSHRPLSMWCHQVTCLPPKMPVLREAVLARGDWPLLYDKLAISNTYSHAKNRNDPGSITLPKLAFLKSGFYAFAILGVRWLQSPASDGPPWSPQPSIGPFPLRYAAGSLPWGFYQIWKIVGCTFAGNAGTVFPSSDFKGNR